MQLSQNFAASDSLSNLRSASRLNFGSKENRLVLHTPVSSNESSETENDIQQGGGQLGLWAHSTAPAGLNLMQHQAMVTQSWTAYNGLYGNRRCKSCYTLLSLVSRGVMIEFFT